MTILQKTTASSTSLTNTSYEQLDTMTFTSAEVADGHYLAVFTANIDGTTSNDSIINVALFQGGTIVAHTEREFQQESSHDSGVRRTCCIIAHVEKTSGQVLEIRWKRDIETWNSTSRTFNLFPATSGDFTDANSVTNDTTTSSSYEVLNNSTFTTPASGDYLMNFTCSAESDSVSEVAFAIFVGGSIVQHSQRILGGNSSFPNVEETILCQAKVSPNGSQDVEIRFKRNSGSGTSTCLERTSVLLKLGTSVGVVEASGTVDDSDSTTSDQVLDDLTITTPDSGEYLAMFSGHETQAVTAGELITNSIFVDTTEENSTIRLIENDGSNDDGFIPVASTGNVNPDGSEDVSAHWQSDATETRVMHDRTLILLSEFEQGGAPPATIPVIEATQIFDVTSNATTTGSITLSLGTISENDIILAVIAIDGDAANPTATPATYATITSASEGAVELYYLWKRQGATPDTTITINWTGSEQCRVMLLRVSGVILTGDPWDVISSAVLNSASTTNVINRLTSTGINTLAVYAVAVDRNRVDSGDTITGTDWNQVGVSGSSGPNAAGLIVGSNEMPTVVQVEAGTFGTWASDQNASRGFNLKAEPVAEANEQQFMTVIRNTVENIVRQVSVKKAKQQVHEQLIKALHPLTKAFNFASILFAVTRTLTHDTDSVLKKLDNEISHDTDSVLRQIDNEITHTTDSILKAIDNELTHDTDSILKQIDNEISHDTDSVLKALDTEISHDTDSVLKQLDNELTHDTDSVLKQLDNEITHDTDSILKQLDNEVAHTTDSYLVMIVELTHDTDSVLKKIDTRTHDTDSVLLQVDNEITHTTDSVLVKRIEITHDTDSVLKKIDIRTHDTDSVLKKIDIRTHDTDSTLKQLDNEIDHTTDSVLKQLDNEITHDTDSVLKQLDNEIFHTTDSLISAGLVVVELEHTTDSVLKKLDNLISHTTSSILKKLDNERTHDTDSVLKQLDNEISHTTDSFLFFLRILTHTTDSILKKIDNLISHTTDSILKKITTLTHDTDSVLKKLDNLITHDTDSTLKQLNNEITHDTDSTLIKIDNLITHDTDSTLKELDNELTHTTDSFLILLVLLSHDTDSLLKKVGGIRTHTTDSRLVVEGGAPPPVGGSGRTLDKPRTLDKG